MTPLELQRALGQMPSRSAQTLTFHCLEARPALECAALYGIGLPQWELLYFEAARALAGDTRQLPDAVRAPLARQLRLADEVLLEGRGEPRPPEVEATLRNLQLTPLIARLRALAEQRDEVQALIVAAERAAAASPARAREGWLRKLAVVAILAVSLFVWLRERNRTAPPTPTPTQIPLPAPGMR